jgi:hypothetical protein
VCPGHTFDPRSGSDFNPLDDGGLEWRRRSRHFVTISDGAKAVHEMSSMLIASYTNNHC